MDDEMTPKETRLLKGVRFDVLAVDYPRRSGGVMRREVVRPADAVVILPVLDEQTLVLIRNERFAVGDTLWELPAGTLEAGEDPLTCAGRELTEETGYVATTIKPLVEFYSSPGFCTEKLSAYVATGLSFEGQDLDETERIEVQPVSCDEVRQMLRDNRIRDGKTIATLLHYFAFGQGDG